MGEFTDPTDITQVKKSESSEFVAVLVVEKPQELVGKEFVIDSVAIVGRSSSVNVVIPERTVSRKHAFVEFNPKTKRLYVKDLNSTNSTFINGKKITAGYVKPGDRISFGKVVVRFELRTYVEQAIREKMIRQAIYDSLTGLFNRSVFEQEVKKAILNEERFSIAFIDLDNFKFINDTYGHQKGDEILRSFAETLKRAIRDTDIAARFGGDEIVILFRNIGKDVAENIIRRIKARTKDLDFSYGVAEFPSDGRSISDLIRLADEKLYENKRKKKSGDSG